MRATRFVQQLSKYRSAFTRSAFTRSALPIFAVGTGFALSTPYVLAKESKVDYDAVRKDIAAILDQEDHDDGSLGPIFVRLAWHSSGTFDKSSCTGGSSGSRMRFEPECKWEANAGLDVARKCLEKIKEKYPGISYSDLWTLAGAVSIEEMSGPKIAWRPGRTDAPDGKDAVSDGRLPDAAQGADHLRTIFFKMGFNDQEIVALAGAHALGRCHSGSSGYEGPWTRAPTTFSNEFYRELLENTWTPKKWNGPEQFADPTDEIMMLPADMAIAKDPAFRKWAVIYKNDEQRFFKDFAAAFQKLEELGCTFPDSDNTSFTPAVLLAALIGLTLKS